MKKKVWIVIAVAAFAVSGVCIMIMGKSWLQKEEARKQYETMQKQEAENARKRQEPEKEAKQEETKKLDIPVDFESFQEKNSDIYGWITIPGTEIDYPIVQSEEDNSFYLDHSAEKTESRSGAIFSENYNSREFDDYITVLYGHNMRDGSMFAGLHRYQDREYLKEHEDITIYLPDAILKYKIFAAYLTDDKHVLLYYNQGETEENRKAYIDEIMDQRTMDASVDTSVELDENTKILTLSTCHRAGKSYRYLVQAYLVEEVR